MRRALDDENRPGQHDLPGGAVDPGETIEQGVLREIEEEIGLLLASSNISLAYTETAMKNQTNLIRFMFIGKISSSDLVTLSHEHEDSYWFTLDRAIQEFEHPIWGRALSYIKENGILPA